MVYGYCSISTKRQSIERQKRNIKAAFPEAVIVEEAYSGTSVKRPQWDRLLQKLKENDVIVFSSISRILLV